MYRVVQPKWDTQKYNYTNISGIIEQLSSLKKIITKKYWLGQPVLKGPTDFH